MNTGAVYDLSTTLKTVKRLNQRCWALIILDSSTRVRHQKSPIILPFWSHSELTRVNAFSTDIDFFLKIVHVFLEKLPEAFSLSLCLIIFFGYIYNIEGKLSTINTQSGRFSHAYLAIVRAEWSEEDSEFEKSFITKL